MGCTSVDTDSTVCPSALSTLVNACQCLYDGAVEIRVAILPDGLDPDQLARERPEEFQVVLAIAQPWARWFLAHLRKQAPPASQTEARERVEEVMAIVTPRVSDSDRAQLLQKLRGGWE